MPEKRDRTEYIRQWRTTPAGIAGVKAQNRRDRAKHAALRDLSMQYQDEYNRLFQHYMKTLD